MPLNQENSDSGKTAAASRTAVGNGGDIPHKTTSTATTTFSRRVGGAPSRRLAAVPGGSSSTLKKTSHAPPSLWLDNFPSRRLIYRMFLPVALLCVLFSVLDRLFYGDFANLLQAAIPSDPIPEATTTTNATTSADDLRERIRRSQSRRFEGLHSLSRPERGGETESAAAARAGARDGSSRAVAAVAVPPPTRLSAPSGSGNGGGGGENDDSDSIGIPRTRTTLTDPDLFVNSTTVTLVLTARTNFERRQVARETWAVGHAVYFVVGGTPTDAVALSEEASAGVQGQLEKEQDRHRDILDIRYPDSYASLPYKIKLAYQWVVHALPGALWILKVDDDTVARVDTLERAFLRNFSPRVPMVLGRIIPRSIVSKEGKWAEPKYNRPFYPYWPMGSCGHVVSRPVATYIAELRDPVYYQGEDTSIAIWLDESPLQVTWVRSPYFVNEGNCMIRNFIVIGHQLTPEQMKACYAAGDEWSEEEIRQRASNLLHVDTQLQRPVWSMRNRRQRS